MCPIGCPPLFNWVFITQIGGKNMLVAKEIRSHLFDILKDDETPYGGTAFEGERLIDFLEETMDNDKEITLQRANDALVECGICPIG